jgi:hypothetical protein
MRRRGTACAIDAPGAFFAAQRQSEAVERGRFLATPLWSCMSAFGGPYARSCGVERRAGRSTGGPPGYNAVLSSVTPAASLVAS